MAKSKSTASNIKK